MKKNIPSSCFSLSPNQKLSKPDPKIGLMSISRRRVQSPFLPDNSEPLPRAADRWPEIPNVNSVAAMRTNATNKYVPINFLFVEGRPINTTTRIPTHNEMKEVALCALENSHQIPIRNAAISRSSL